jgi:hypothetical protein
MKELVAFAIALGASGVACATVIDNGQFGANISPLGGLEGSDAYAQSFVAPSDARLIKFGMWLTDGEPAAPAVRVDLWADDGFGNPDENNILVEGLIIQEIIPGLTRFDTLTDYDLSPGVRYHVVLNAFGDQDSPGSYISTYDAGTDTIPDGEMNFTNDFGASWHAFPASDFGIYVETLDGGCYPDFTGEGDLDLFDFLAYVNSFNDAEDRADCTEDGALDFFDFLCFANAFNDGC